MSPRAALTDATPDSRDRLDRLNALLATVREHNAFQRSRLPAGRLETLEDLESLPVTRKADLLADQEAHPPFGTNLTWELHRYTHLHQTSGTTAATLRVLDSAEDWEWWTRCLARVFTAAGLTATDRVALAYSFGPYVQFWASYAGVQAIGAMSVPMGGMDSLQRLDTLREYEATAILCTPSYAAHLAKVAAQSDMTGAFDTVQRVICTGEPGASLPAVHEEIERAWQARCYDHAGLSEVGAFAYPCDAAGGLHLAEDDFLFELLDPASGELVAEGGTGELVITALGRAGFPVVRYGTGDIAEHTTTPCPGGHADPWLPGGILGRTDDMVVIRGMNVFPSAIEQTLRESSGIGEFRITFYTDPHAMDEVKVVAELARPAEARDIQARMRQRLGLRVRIVPIQPGVLPAQIGKARRVEDQRARARPGERSGG